MRARAPCASPRQATLEAARPLLFAALCCLLLAGAAFGWHPEAAFFDPAALTASASAKPGGGGVLGTGSSFGGGVACVHCHHRPVAGPLGHIDAGVAFSPPLAAGRYAPGQQYQVTVTMTGEHHLISAFGGMTENGFAGMFEGPDGGVAGALTADTAGFSSTACVATLPAPLPVAGSTVVFGDCHGIIGRSEGKVGVNTWTFSWAAPATSVGPITFFYGVVDGNSNDRTALADGGGDDDAIMKQLVLDGP